MKNDFLEKGKFVFEGIYFVLRVQMLENSTEFLNFVRRNST